MAPRPCHRGIAGGLQPLAGTADGTGMQQETGERKGLGRRAKIGGIAAIAVVALLFLMEWTLLRGERVAWLTVGLGPGDAEKILIDRVGEEHLVEVDTRRRRHGETEGRAVKVRLTDPDGRVVHEEGEWTSRKERFFSFTPEVAGSYLISVRPDGVLPGSSHGMARVSVFVGDRRILTPLMAALPF